MEFFTIIKIIYKNYVFSSQSIHQQGSAFEAFEIISVTVAPIGGVIFTDAAPIFTSSAKAVKAPSNPKGS